MSHDGDASIEFTLLDRPNLNFPEAPAALHPDGHAADPSFPSFVLVDGSGAGGAYPCAVEGDQNQSGEQSRGVLEIEVYKEPTMHPIAYDGVAATTNVEYTENPIPQMVPKTVSIVDIFAKNQAPQELELQYPSVGFTEPPRVPETFPRDPAPQGGKGEGWPYAPQGWPKPDDKWGWRVGQRAAANSLWIDRYVTLPASLMKGKKPTSDEQFASKKSLAEYLRQKFPQMKDPNIIFNAFDWKVPAPKSFEAHEKRGPTVKREKASPMDGDDNWQKAKKQCRAGNPHCPLTKGKNSVAEPEILVCHICCSEPRFCRECKCILCCEIFAPDGDDFTIIRCLNSPLRGEGQGVCGHAAHLECALNSQLAGVIPKNGLELEYMCRRCDRKTHLKPLVSRLVREFMNKTAPDWRVDRSLRLLLRVVQDPEDGARCSGKLHETLIGSLKKVQEGADLVESCKELTEQLLDLHELQSGRSQATGRKRTSEDLLHPNETSVDKRVPRLKSLGSSDALATFSTSMFQENNKSTPVIINAQQACSNDTSPAEHRIDSIVVSKGGCEADGFTTTTGTIVQLDLNMDKQLTSTSRQNSPQPGDIVLSITALQAPSDLLSCTPLLSSLLNQSVCKPPTLSLEEHIRQCEAMADRVKGAGQIISSPGIFSVPLSGTPEVDLNSESKPPNLAPGSLAVESHGIQVDVNPVSEAPDDTELPSAEKLVTSIPSSSRAKSPCLLDSKDADEDHIANRVIVEVRRSSRLSSSRQAKSPSLSGSQHLGGDKTASTKIIDVSKTSRKKPPTSSSGGKIPSSADSQDADADDVVITQIIDVPMETEPLPMIELPTIPSFDPALKTTHAAGLEMEFEDQISEALEKLKTAQAAEYARAEESLRAQKKNVIEQYQQLEKVCGQFAKKKEIQLSPRRFRKHLGDKPRAEFDRAMNCLMAQYGKAQEGQKVFESMLAISDGFGQVSKEFLRDFFKWPPSDITEA